MMQKGWENLLQQSGAEDDLIQIVAEWGEDEQRDRRLRSCFTHRLEDTVKQIRHLLAVPSPVRKLIEAQVEILHRLLGPERSEYIDAVFAQSTKRQM